MILQVLAVLRPLLILTSATLSELFVPSFALCWLSSLPGDAHSLSALYSKSFPP